MLTAIGFGFAGIDKALSILLGGLISLAGSGLFIWMYFYRIRVRQTAHNILQTAYRAELSKLVLTLFLFVITIVTFKGLDFLLFIAAFFISQLISWIAPLLFRRLN